MAIPTRVIASPARGVECVKKRAKRLHFTAFSRDAAQVATASGRVNLMGDHVDYAGGFVLPMALSLHTAVAASRADHDCAVSESSDDRAWTRYAFGVLTQLRDAGLSIPPLSLAVASDVPVGAGLSSSAALEVAVARVALAVVGAALEPRALALLCQRAEHIGAGVPCGIMDQWCVTHAQPHQSIMLDCARLTSTLITLPPTMVIDIVDSDERHALRDGGYAARRADVEAAARALRVPLLAQLPRARWHEIDALAPQLARRARHVVHESARVHEMCTALAANDLARVGALFFESHQSLRDDFDVSTHALDAIVERARSEGVLGARMTGGGFGGCVIIVRRA